MDEKSSKWITKKYFKEVMDYIGIDPDYFIELCDKFRSPRLWEKENDE